MADEGIFATTLEVQRKAGANASAVSNVEAYINDYMTQVESSINAESNNNWSDVYSTLNVDLRGILKELASNLAAIYVIEYHMGAIGRGESQDRINVLTARADKLMKILKDQDAQALIKKAA